MIALSIKQPFINQILTGQKTKEFRPWQTKYRGDILLCASKTSHDKIKYNDIDLGVTICIVNLYDIIKVKNTTSYYANKEFIYAWLFDNVRPTNRLPVKGKLNLYQVSLDKSYLFK